MPIVSALAVWTCKSDDSSTITLEQEASTTSAIVLFILRDTEVAVLELGGIGGGRLRGELHFQAKTEPLLVLMNSHHLSSSSSHPA